MFQKLSAIEAQITWLPYLYGMMSSTTIVFLQMCMKTIDHTVHPFFAIAFRAFGMMLICLTVLKNNEENANLKNQTYFRIIVKRTLMGSVTFMIIMTAVRYVPIAIVNALYNLGPIMIFFIEAIHQKKSISYQHFFFTIICFIGVLLIIKPEFIFSNEERTYQLKYIILPFISSITVSYGMYYLHQLKGKVSSNNVLFHFYFIQTLMGGVLLNFAQVQFKQEISMQFIGCLLLLFPLSYLAQTLITRAGLLKKASRLMPFNYTGIIVSLIVDVVIYNAHFDFLSILGIFLTSVGLLSKIFIKDDQK